MQVFLQSDRRKNPQPVEVRPMTREEILALSHSRHVPVILNNGRLGECKINGAVRTWKTQPDRVEVPVKYGMYEYATLNLNEALRHFVVVEA